MLLHQQKEQNRCGFAVVFTLTINFQCVGTLNDYEEELNSLKAWLATPFLNEVCIEVSKINVEDNIDDGQINEIFGYWSREEILFYYNLMLQQIDDEKSTTKHNMWQQPTYKPFFQEAQDMLKHFGTKKDLDEQMKTLRFEGYNKEKKLKQFRGYMIQKKSKYS